MKYLLSWIRIYENENEKENENKLIWKVDGPCNKMKMIFNQM